MNKKYIISTLSLSALLLTSTTVSFAQTATSPAYPRARHEMQINKNTTAPNANLTTVQQRADQLITQRIASLQMMLTKIDGIKRLTAAQKSQLTTNITNDIAGLNTLKTKIDADTDVATALTDTKSIYTTFRVYAEFEPQTGILTASDALSKTIDQLTLLATKLQTRISSASAAGNNVTTLTPLLSDMQAKIADAKTQVVNAQNSVSSLTPSNFNASPSGTHTTFINSHNWMSIARNDLRIALQDAMKIIAGLKTFKALLTTTPINSTPSTTVSPADTMTPTPTI